MPAEERRRLRLRFSKAGKIRFTSHRDVARMWERALRRSRLGIDEPDNARSIGARWLDLVFLPLVGFDRSGVRLGSGGGFYDRAFAFRRWRQAWHAPRLVGLAYAFQQVAHIAAAAHDVRMDAVITEEGFIRCTTG